MACVTSGEPWLVPQGSWRVMLLGSVKHCHRRRWMGHALPSSANDVRDGHCPDEWQGALEVGVWECGRQG